MNIAIDGQTFASPDADRGIGVYLRQMLSHLPVGGGNAYHVLRWGALPPGMQLPAGVVSVRMAGVPAGGAGVQRSRFETRNRAVREFVARADCRVLFNPNPLQPGVEPLSRPGRAALVATLYDLTPLVLGPAMFPVDTEACMERYRARIGHLRLHADHLVAISHASARDAVALLGWPEKKVSVVRCGVGGVFREAPREAVTACLEAFGLGEAAGRYVLSVGGFNPKKNLPRVLEAVGRLPAALQRRHPFVVAGPMNAQEQAELRGLAARLCPECTVHFTGYVDEAALAALYTGAALLAFVSLHEGFGLPVLEAMACGCPVVASDVSSIPEVAGGAARLCDPHDAEAIRTGLQEVLTDDKLRDTLRGAGLARCREFGWQKAAAELADVLAKAAPPTQVAVAAGRPRLRLAFASPFPPFRGGVSAYSAGLIEELAEHADVTVAWHTHDPVLPAKAAALPRVRIGNLQDHASEYDLLVFNMGNNTEQFAPVYEAMKAISGLCILHDLNIHGFLLDYLVRAAPPPVWRRLNPFRRPGGEEHPYRREMRAAYGAAGEAIAEEVLRLGRQPDIPGHPCHRLVTARSLGVVCHSAWGRAELEANGDLAPAFRLPLWMDPPPAVSGERIDALRRMWGIGADGFALVSAGYLEPSRRLETAVHALAELARRNVDVKLVLVGAANAALAGHLAGLARELGVGERVRFEGFAESDGDFLAALAAADCVLHLRHPTNGESSSTVLRALGLKRPVIVSNSDGYRELPDDCCWKVDAGAREVALLSEYIGCLAARPEVRQAMGNTGLRYVAGQHSRRAAAGRLVEICRETLEFHAARR